MERAQGSKKYRIPLHRHSVSMRRNADETEEYSVQREDGYGIVITAC